MGLTLSKRFGTGASIDETTPSDPILKIHLNTLKNVADGGDITNSQGLNTTITAANADANADRIASALILLWSQQQPTDNTSDTLGIWVGAFYKQFVTRNVQEQLAYIFPIELYTPDPTGGTIDPDDVVIA